MKQNKNTKLKKIALSINSGLESMDLFRLFIPTLALAFVHTFIPYDCVKLPNTSLPSLFPCIFLLLNKMAFVLFFSFLTEISGFHTDTHSTIQDY